MLTQLSLNWNKLLVVIIFPYAVGCTYVRPWSQGLFQSGNQDSRDSSHASSATASGKSDQKTPSGGDFIVGDRASIDKFRSLNSLERALLIISADNGMRIHDRSGKVMRLIASRQQVQKMIEGCPRYYVTVGGI